MGEAHRLAVIGDPIAHSLSPLLHNTMAQELGLPWTYEARRVTVEELPAWADRVRAGEWDGFNATMPHKLHLIPMMDQLTREAAYFGAVNSVRRDGARLTGHNTDGDGFAASLKEHGLGFRGTRVTVLGAGGAAGAIVRKAILDGAASVTVMNRTVARAEALCALKPEAMRALPLDGPVPPETELLISTIPGADPRCADLAAGLNGDCAVFDILYAPPRTPLLLAAEARGLKAVNGLGMLIHQAILAFTFFTGAAVDPATMAPVLYDAVDSQG